jgi:hypothetical protein
MRSAKRRAARLAQHDFLAVAAGGQLLKEPYAFARQDDVPRLAGLRLPNSQRPGVRVEIGDFELDQLAVARAGLQPSLHQNSGSQALMSR